MDHPTYQTSPPIQSAAKKHNYIFLIFYTLSTTLIFYICSPIVYAAFALELNHPSDTLFAYLARFALAPFLLARLFYSFIFYKKSLGSEAITKKVLLAAKLFIAADILILLVIYFGLSDVSIKKNNTTIIPTNKHLVSNPTLDPTADWKTYANTKYEYSLSYPGTWNLDSQNDSVMLSSSDYKSEEIEGISTITEGAKITIDTRESEYENTELLKEYYDSTEVIGYQNGFVLTSLGGLEAIRSSCGHYVPGVCYEIISDKTHYTIRYSPARKNVYIEEFDQILQTFKFAESNLMLGKPPSKNCDLNEDEVCNLQDETLINAAMGSRRGDNNYNPLADVDADGSVTIDDKKMLFPVTMPAR